MRAQTWSRVGGTSLRVLWERCSEPMSDNPRSYHLGDVPKNTMWGSFGPLGPSRGICRPNRTAKSRNKSCTGQIGAVWKRVLVFGDNEGRLAAIKFKKNVFFLFFFTESPSRASPKTRFWPHLGLWRAFLDVNQSLGRVKRSDLVQSGRNTYPDIVGAL